MSLIESHNHHSLGARLHCSEKVTLEPFEKKEGTNVEPKFEYHYSYNLIINNNPHVSIIFISIGEPGIEKVNRLLMNIMKSIYKLTHTNGCHNRETTLQRYEEIIKDSIHYTVKNIKKFVIGNSESKVIKFFIFSTRMIIYSS